MKFFKNLLVASLCLCLCVASISYAGDITGTYDYEATASFADVPETHWAYKQITSLAGNGVFEGDEYNRLFPDEYLTKAETAKIVTKYMQLEPYTEGEFAYADVSEGAWYCEFAYSANEFFPKKENSYGQRLFEGDKRLTRAELCYVVAHMVYAESEASFYDEKKLEDYEDFDTFDEELAPYVAIMLDKGLIKAYDNNTLRLYDPVSKADLATMLYDCVTPKIYADVSEDGVQVIQKYGEEDKLKVTIKPAGPNSIPDFYEWAFKDLEAEKKAEEEESKKESAKKEQDLSNVLSNFYVPSVTSAIEEEKETEKKKETDASFFRNPVKTGCTDYFSPYLVRAVSNIDGDQPDSLDFTGGYHSYNNTAHGGSATARNAELKVLVNGVEVEEFSGEAVYIDIITTNYIQATNTRKVNGDGREVLKETRSIHCDGDKWNFSVETEALEDVYMYEYFGPQFDLVGMANKLTFVTGDKPKAVEVGNERLQSLDEKCRKILLEGEDIDTEIAVESDLFKRYNERSFSSFYETYGKTYFNVIFSCSSPMLLKAGETFTLEGYYKFNDIPEEEEEEDEESEPVEETQPVQDDSSAIYTKPYNYGSYDYNSYNYGSYNYDSSYYVPGMDNSTYTSPSSNDDVVRALPVPTV